MDWIHLLIISAIAALLLPMVIRLAPRVGLLDTPNGRSMHKKRTPRGGGIAMFAAVAAVLTLAYGDHLLTHGLVYGAIVLVFAIGLADDLYDVSPRTKFAVIFIAAACLYVSDIYVRSLGHYFGYDVTLPLLLLFPFSLFAIAGFTNALNLIDGLDGLAGMVSLIILITFLAIGIHHNDELIVTLASTFIMALIPFLLFNWNPAKIFMGDSGSLMLGFVIATLSILSLRYASPTSILFIIALPLLDTFIVMTRRYQRGQSLFRADKNHLHHFLVNVKGDVRFSVIILASIQAIFSIIGFQLREGDDFLSLLLFSLLFFVFLNLFDQRIRRRKRSKLLNRRKRGTKPDQNVIIQQSEPEVIASPIFSQTEAA